MQIESKDFEPFADTAEYIKVNGEIARRWVEISLQRDIIGADRILDLASGVGTMVQLFLAQLPSRWKKPAVVILDQSRESLKLAKERLKADLEELELCLVHSRVEEMALPSESVDVVLWGNGIHYLSAEAQKEALYRIKLVLRRGGWFFFNTAFYDGARPPETLPFYRTQIKKAVELLRSLGVEKVRTQSRPESASFLQKSHYKYLLEEVGFKVEEMKEYAAFLGREAWEHISSFRQYAEGALHGYPPDEAAVAMKEVVASALKQHGARDDRGNLYILRNWLAISATR